jgi:hypothetical protein
MQAGALRERERASEREREREKESERETERAVHEQDFVAALATGDTCMRFSFFT